MPVVVTGAACALAREVVLALRALESGAEIRATVRRREDRAWYAKRGVPVAVTDLSDPLLTGAVLEGAHTVVHLDDPVTTWEWLLDAAQGTSVRRIVAVVPGASSDALPAPGVEVVVLAGDVQVPDARLVAAVLSADARA